MKSVDAVLVPLARSLDSICSDSFDGNRRAASITPAIFPRHNLHHQEIPIFAPLTPFRFARRCTAKMPATTAETLSLVTRNVSVAPLVLLSAADHYGRQAKGTRKRVVGVLLGQNDGKNVRVSNSFAGMQPLQDLVCRLRSRWRYTRT